MSRAARPEPVQVRLQVDPVACDGIGLCAHLAPDLVTLDRWGYPVVATSAVPESAAGAARRAVRACPRRALWIDRAHETAPAVPFGASSLR